MLEDHLTEYVYNAYLAGVGYSFYNTMGGYSLSIEGYNEKQAVFLERLLQKIVEFKPQLDRFKILKERHVRYLKNLEMEQPYKRGIYHASILMTDKIWTNEEILKELES